MSYYNDAKFMTDLTPKADWNRMSGADSRHLTDPIEEHVGSPESTTPLSPSDKFPAAPSTVEKVETQEELEVRLRGLMNQSNVVHSNPYEGLAR